MAKSYAKATGKSAKSAPFVMFPRAMLDSAIYESLNYPAAKLLTLIARQYNGTNNGDLTAAWTVMACAGWKSRDTLYRAIKELDSKGFIVRTRQGWQRAASLYGITWKGIDPCGGKHSHQCSPAPGNQWRERNPPFEADRRLRNAEKFRHANWTVSPTFNTASGPKVSAKGAI